jgi:CRISPR-associated exonuclease Cas4
MEQEHVTGGQGAENVALGQQLHADSYPGQARKDILVDDLLRIDFTESGVVHEIKKSRGALKATRMQLLYYLFYLKREKGMETTGMIDFPTERRRESVELTPEAEREIEQVVAGVLAVRAAEQPPPVPAPMSICKKCSYQDLCWG